jgi:hypothetical protein
MTGTRRRLMNKLRSWGSAMRATAGKQLRALIPPITPAVFFRALGGILLFFCGIVYGVWLIIRYRRHSQDSSS